MINQKGGSLLEVMIAVLVFAIGLAALLSVFTASSTMSRRGEMAYVSYNLARNRVELLKGSDFAALADYQETDTRIDRDGNEDAAGDYVRTTAVSTYLGETELAQVDVNVRYYFRGALSPSSMDVTTVIYEGG